MTSTAALQESDAAATLSGMPRVASEIPVENCKVQSSGNCWTEHLIRLPAGAIFADLADPRIFRKVQSNGRTALVKGDKVRFVSYLEEWCCECIVASANDESVTLTKPVRYELQARTEISRGDDKNDIVFTAQGYRVRRKSDQQYLTNPVQTLEGAERALRDLYPKPVTGRM